MKALTGADLLYWPCVICDAMPGEHCTTVRGNSVRGEHAFRRYRVDAWNDAQLAARGITRADALYWHCYRCGANSGQPCRTSKGRATRTHAGRLKGLGWSPRRQG